MPTLMPILIPIYSNIKITCPRWSNNTSPTPWNSKWMIWSYTYITIILMGTTWGDTFPKVNLLGLNKEPDRGTFDSIVDHSGWFCLMKLRLETAPSCHQRGLPGFFSLVHTFTLPFVGWQGCHVSPKWLAKQAKLFFPSRMGVSLGETDIKRLKYIQTVTGQVSSVAVNRPNLVESTPRFSLKFKIWSILAMHHKYPSQVSIVLKIWVP